MSGLGDERGAPDDDGRVLDEDAVGESLVGGQGGHVAAHVPQGVDVVGVLLAGQVHVDLLHAACSKGKVRYIKTFYNYFIDNHTLARY